jgi:hypothetical protein
MNKIILTALAGVSLLAAGCVAVPVGPITGGGGATTTAAAPDLRSQLAGRSLTVPAWTYFLWSDGSLTHNNTFTGEQTFGTWTVQGNTLCLQHQGQNCGTVVINGNVATFSSVSGDTPINYTLG